MESRRAGGNLPFRRTEEGDLLFDERTVAQFFSSRVPSIFSARVPSGPHLGLLGVTKLGDNPSQSALSPPASRRTLRFLPGELPAPLARTGSDRGR